MNKHKTFRRAAFYLTAIVCLALLYLFLDTKLIQLRFELDAVNRRLEKLYNENRELGAKVSNLRSLSRISEIAAKQLGMKRPEEIHYIKITKIQDTISKQ